MKPFHFPRVDLHPLEALIGRKVETLRRFCPPDRVLNPLWSVRCEDGTIWELTGLQSLRVETLGKPDRYLITADRADPVSSFTEPDLVC